MKKIYTILAAVLLTATLWAQSPEKMSYQAVVRNSSNNLVSEQAVGMQISILQGSADGMAVYTETQNVTTNANGLVSLEIGTGETANDFSSIDWSAGPYFIKTETDPKGGNNYTITGTSQLMSVPYALYAKNSGSSVPGPQGEQGIQGEMGVQGIQGLAGADGAKGDKGDKGETGAQGIQGAKGETGATGPKGEQGIQGDKGDKGETGAQGIQGDKGDTGAQGIQGLQGDQGIQGVAGVAGAKGDQGIQGIAGAKGDAGVQGIQGETGAQGIQGVAGVAGVNGDKGDKGDTGAQGIQGDKGETGAQGIAGADGVKGDKGDTGANGPQGIQGLQGIQGVAGAKGDKGDTGADGVGGVTQVANASILSLTGAGTAADPYIMDATEADPVFAAWDKDYADITNKPTTITTAQADAITANTAKVGYTDALVSANANVTANTAKVGITTAQANAIVANTAKVGITTIQANAITANTAKVGVTPGTAAGQMQYWNGTAWVVVAPGYNGSTLTYISGVPTWKYELQAGEVGNPTTGKLWMDRNLGASQVATSSTDAASYGDLYQWGRSSDGHQIRTSGTTATLSTTDTPGHSNFITNSISDWRSTQNDNLWQGVSGINNPCPSGYRLPTNAEWNAEQLSWGSNNPAGAFASPLKLPAAGNRELNGSLTLVGSYGYYWSSTIFIKNSWGLYFNASSAGTFDFKRAYGNSVRCIKD